eukprot:scaffold362317_cov47-Prasinocladus_malaysianus.AAC.2
MMYVARQCLAMGGTRVSEGSLVPSLQLSMIVSSLLACNHVTVYGMNDLNFTGHFHPHVRPSNHVFCQDTIIYAHFTDVDHVPQDSELESRIIMSLGRKGLVRLCGPEDCIGKELPSYIRPSDAMLAEDIEEPPREEPADESESDLYGDRDNDDFMILVD